MDYIIKFTDTTKSSFVIKPYTTNGTVSPSSNTLDPYAVSANTSILFLGQGIDSYGERLANNFLHLLEHFAGPNAPVHPIQGQLWYKNSTKVLNVYNGTTWDSFLTSTSMGGDLNMNSHKITNLLCTSPAGTDAINKTYADSIYLKKDGSTTMTGDLNMGGHSITGLHAPSGASDAATKNYVDTALLGGANYVVRSGDTGMTGAFTISTGSLTLVGAPLTLGGNFVINGTRTIDMGGNRVINSAAPIASTDLATKGYVDSVAGGGGGGGGSDGNISGIDFNATTGLITATSTIGGPFVSTNPIAPAVHTHLATSVTNNTGSAMVSRLQQVLGSTSGFPGLTQQVINDTLDTELYYARARNDRTIYTSTAQSIIAVSQAVTSVSVAGVITGLNGKWYMGGDFTSVFIPGYKFVITGNAFSAANGTYTTLSSVYSSGNTQITVQETIPVGTTISGSFAARGGSYTIAGNHVLEYSNGSKIIVSGNTGGGNGTFVVYNPVFNGSNTVLQISSTTNLPSGSTANGTFVKQSFVSVIPFVVEANKAQVFINGIKQYKSSRGFALLQVNPTIKLYSDTGLTTSPRALSVNIDGTANTVTITPSISTYAVIGVNPTNKTWTIAGNHTAEYVTYQTIKLTNTTPAGVANGYYTVSNTTFTGGNTVITVFESIPGTTTVGGSVNTIYTWQKMVTDLNAGLNFVGASCFLENNYIYIFSNTTGPTSQITVTDVTLLASLIIPPSIINGPIGATYSYKEIGTVNSTSQVIEFETAPLVGDVVEIINVR